MKKALDPQLESFAKALCNKNPGAEDVIAQLLAHSADPSYYIIRLFNMQITGWKILACYKDICKNDIVLFQKKIQDMSILTDFNKNSEYEHHTITKNRCA